ncbi:hypothetical protein Slin_2086 [Spirosoma linguale DSM 74]|uniref:Uncharacterized protein n=1 Tax=Spirosoma linguale (strain ATCC 33905 / DSM 74 / LMG 10896 / Claus 1) TaxID=504472 RepID=D2QDJ5_SPILD|nr:hypothetical protein Slin_2086 [Spirosoma linguale DSM 74]
MNKVLNEQVFKLAIIYYPIRQVRVTLQSGPSLTYYK